MYISNLKAEPNACGGQIDLSWKNPSIDEFPNFAGVKIVRREKRFPKISLSKDAKGNFIYDGTPVYEGADENFSDTGLHGERVYYYTLYTFDGLNLFSNRTSRIAAMASSHYGSEDELYKLVPAIYRRYDTDRELKRFLEIFGSQLDLIRSFIAGTRNFSNLDQCHGALLPLLAQWIGWETNFSLDLNSQRNEIRQAPELYKTLGITANLRAFINRLINWNCQIKEFVHNVFLSNNPEQLHIRETTRQNGVWQPAKPITLDVAYEGKMAAVSAQDGRQWLFYHARSNVFVPGTHLKKGEDKDLLHIYYKICDRGEWLPSHRLTFDGEINKYPAAVQDKKGNFWVFWSAYSEREGKTVSQIKLTLLSTGNVIKPAHPPSETPPTHNIEPAVFKDNQNHIWLFWSSRRSGRWKIWYNRFNAKTYKWGTAKQLTNGLEADREPAVLFDRKNGGKIWVFWSRKEIPLLFSIDSLAFQVDLDKAILPEGLKQEFENIGITLSQQAKVSIEIKCSRWQIIDKNTYLIKKEDNCLDIYGPEVWNIFYRTKPNTNFNKSTWNDEAKLSPVPHGQKYDNRESTVRVDRQGNILVYWSSNRSGSWNIWHKTYDKEQGTWSDETPVTFGHFTKKAPALLEDETGSIRLLFRTNESITYPSSVYPGTTTTDSRYSGSTTIDVKNREKIGSRRLYDDIMHYVYDTGIKGKPTNNTWYARDTIGIYLTADTQEQQLITKNRELVEGILDRFLPIHLRAVFIIDTAYVEKVYSKDGPPQLIEQFCDSTIPEVYPGVSDVYEDRVPGWIWIHTQDAKDKTKYQDHRTVDFNTSPVDTNHRTKHIGVKK